MFWLYAEKFKVKYTIADLYVLVFIYQWNFQWQLIAKFESFKFQTFFIDCVITYNATIQRLRHGFNVNYLFYVLSIGYS